MNTEGEDRQIDAQGFALASSVFETPRSDTIVVINAATGVPRYFYRHFAAYLRDQGWTAVTYDYRGIGGSAPPKKSRSNEIESSVPVVVTADG